MRFAKLLASEAAVLVTLAPLAGPAHADALPWMNTALAPEQRAALLIPAMTQDEKLEQMLGTPGVGAGIAAMFRSPSRRRNTEAADTHASHHQWTRRHRPERLRAAGHAGPAVLRAEQHEFGQGDRHSLGARRGGVLRRECRDPIRRCGRHRGAEPGAARARSAWHEPGARSSRGAKLRVLRRGSGALGRHGGERDSAPSRAAGSLRWPSTSWPMSRKPTGSRSRSASTTGRCTSSTCCRSRCRSRMARSLPPCARTTRSTGPICARTSIS